MPTVRTIVAASAGMGVAVLQPCLVERELASGELVQPFELSVSTGRGYHLCTRAAAEGKNTVEVFTRWIVEMASPGGGGGGRFAG